MSQQSGGSCVEFGQYGVEEELERLKHERSLLVSEVMKLKQQHHNSKEQILKMEERLHCTERKQQQMMRFLAKAFKSPVFVQQHLDSCDKKRIEIGQKRRITMSPSVEDLDEVVTVGTGSGGPLECFRNDDDLNGVLSSEIGLESLDGIWEDFLGDDVIVGDLVQEVLEAERLSDVEVEELVAETPAEWGEDLHDIVDQLGFL